MVTMRNMVKLFVFQLLVGTSAFANNFQEVEQYVRQAAPTFFALHSFLNPAVMKKLKGCADQGNTQAAMHYAKAMFRKSDCLKSRLIPCDERAAKNPDQDAEYDQQAQDAYNDAMCYLRKVLPLFKVIKSDQEVKKFQEMAQTYDDEGGICGDNRKLGNFIAEVGDTMPHQAKLSIYFRLDTKGLCVTLDNGIEIYPFWNTICNSQQADLSALFSDMKL